MRSLALSTGLLLLAAACDGGPAGTKPPPLLEVTSPTRGLLQGQAGAITVTGMVEAGAAGAEVTRVMVNDVPATLAGDGSFTAQVNVGQGATLIQTVATDADGATASDTRAVQAGELRPVGSKIPRAVTAALSVDSFTKLSAAAGPILEGLDLGQLIAPLQPMVHVGGGSTYAKGFIDDIELGDIQLALSPVQGGLAFRAEIAQLDVPGHATYALLGIGGSNTLRITADRIVIAGTLDVTPSGAAGFKTKIVDPTVELTKLVVSASGIPGDIIKLLDLNAAIKVILPTAVELAMGPLMNQALGALGGPQQLDVAGKQLAMQVAPAALAFDRAGAVVAMDLTALIAGGEASPGFVLTENGNPALDASRGFQIGLADDLANELLAELAASGALDLAVAVDGGLFDTAQLHMTLAPSISADARDGTLRLVLGDVLATFLSHGAPVGKAAINARLDLEVRPVAGGGSVALRLGTPEIHVDVLDDVANTTGFEDAQLGDATAVVLGGQLDAISKLLVAIPVPAIAGLQVTNLSLGSESGYVTVKGEFQ